MDYRIRMKTTIDVADWYCHTPPKDHRQLFHAVFSGGHISLDPAHQLQSWPHPGHDILLTTHGSGLVQVGNRRFRASKGDVLWSDNNRADIAWPLRKGRWTFYWVRVDSSHFDLVADALNVRTHPIITLKQPAAAERIYANMVDLLKLRPLTMDVELHAELGLLIATLFKNRVQASQSSASQLPYTQATFRKVFDRIRAEYARSWKIGEMAELMGCSEPKFYRTFRQATGSSPLAWLRHERVNHAKRQLAESTDQIHRIARQVGYEDPYYFSRDFRKLVGVTPRQYRYEERRRRKNGAFQE